MRGGLARRSAGLAFESRPVPLPDALPRMDVAAFVGFASRGPLDVPVPVDDESTFIDVFGAEDPELGWDPEQSEPVHAKLGPSVRAFFRNGGRRCWVVRVTGRAETDGSSRARTNVFPISGLLALSPGGAVSPAFASARSEGSWSDPLMSAASLSVLGIAVERVEWDGDTALALTTSAAGVLTPGDLVRLSFVGGEAWLLPVQETAGRSIRFARNRRVRLLPAAPVSLQWEAGWVPHRNAGLCRLALLAAPEFEADGSVRVVVQGDAPARGLWVRLQATDAAVPVPVVWMHVTSSRSRANAGSAAAAASELEGRWFRPDLALGGVAPNAAAVSSCERLRVGLWARDRTAQARRVEDLGLAPGSPRYFGALPSDRLLFDTTEERLNVAERELRGHLQSGLGDASDLHDYHSGLWHEVATPRFPLAVDAGGLAVFLPLAAQAVPEVYLGARSAASDATERDGLAEYGPTMFLDPELGSQTVLDLQSQADRIRWQQPSPRALTGLHSLLFLDEVTLVSVPDAVHRAWSVEQRTQSDMLPTPALGAASDVHGDWHLRWTASSVSASFVLEESDSATFSGRTLHSLGADVTEFVVPAGAAGRRWFRVRARLLGGYPVAPIAAASSSENAREVASSFWSEPVQIIHPPPEFVACAEPAPAAPQLRLVAAPDVNGSYRLAWGAVSAAAAYTVEESAFFDFESAVVIFTGSEQDVSLYGREPGRYFYRVRAVLGASATSGGAASDGAESQAAPNSGTWSEGLSVTVPSAPRRVLTPTAVFAGSGARGLLEIHAALVRLAAARGDVLAVLGLPEHYRQTEASRHVAELRASLTEDGVCNYAAVYHPWLLAESSAETLRVPPDGAACGVLAARAALRGAWIAPANQPLSDVLGLSPRIAPEQWPTFYDIQVNLVRPDPRGFLALSADTLAQDPDLIPIGVRRLLAVLRRLALRAGPDFAFEPNTPEFRRAVERSFNAVLDGMYRAGAFAGSTANEAFQIAVDESVNPRTSVDQGRFIVELKVAPALPLSFLTVRLVQDGERSRVTEG